MPYTSILLLFLLRLNTVHLGVFCFVFSLTWNKGLVQCRIVSPFKFLGGLVLDGLTL